MKRTLIELIVLLMLGVVSIIEGIRLWFTEDVQISDVLGPGPYNAGAGLLLIIAGLIYFIIHRRDVMPEEKKAERKEDRAKMVSIIVAMVVYIFLMDLLGYLFSSLAFFFLITRVVGFKRWLTNIILSIGLSVSFYIIFVRWLGMIFPRGILLNF